MLKKFLESRGLAYKELQVDRDEKARAQMMEVSGGFMGVPFAVVEKDGETQTIIGFDRNALEKAFGE